MEEEKAQLRVRVEVDADVWSKLRIRAIEQSRSVSEIVNDILRREVKRDGK